MSNGVIPLASVAPTASVAVVPRLEPYLVEVVVLYPFGSADEAVAAAAQTVEALLNGPELGAATVATPPPGDDSPRAANTEFVQGELRRALVLYANDAKTYAAGAALILS